MGSSFLMYHNFKKKDDPLPPITQAIYGVRIDTTSPNPDIAVIYTDDAVGSTPLTSEGGAPSWGSWAGRYPFNRIVPVVVKDGVEQYELDPNDFSKKKDGSPSIITGTDGGVMIKFPKIWWKFEKVGSYLDVKYSTTAQSGFICGAHTSNGIEYDNVYIGAYMGHNDGRLRSISGVLPTANQTLGAFRTLARAHGSNYGLLSLTQVTMIQILGLIGMKGRNSQLQIGLGYTNTNGSHAITGGTDTRGMLYGETTGKVQMKLFGLEDLWGNYYQTFDGLLSDASRNLWITDGNYNDDRTGYTNIGLGYSAETTGYIAQVRGTNTEGFIPAPKGLTGTSTTYYTDRGTIFTNTAPQLGGGRGDGDIAGLFTMRLRYRGTYINAQVSSRLSFMK